MSPIIPRFLRGSIAATLLLTVALLFAPSSRTHAALQINIAMSGTNVVLTWTNAGAALEHSLGVAGGWNEIIGATSPHPVPPTNLASFYRLRVTIPPPGPQSRYSAPVYTSSIGGQAAGGSVSPENPNSLAGGNAQDNGLGNVLPATGEFSHQVVDLVIPGRGMDWRLERRYRSGMSYDGPVGQRWELNYNCRLVVETNGNVLRMDGLGRADRYVLNLGGTYDAPRGFFTQLKSNFNGTFEERDAHGTTSFYAPTNGLGIAQLTHISDRNGNQLLFQHNPAGQLTGMIDTLGRPITYTYDPNGRLTSVADFTGRAVTYAYDPNGDLVSATTPPVTGTPNGNDFPGGKTTLYTYSSGYADPRFNHNLLTVTAPEEAATNGPPRIVAQYDVNSLSPNAGRLLSLLVGGTNVTGIGAGGSIFYSYANLGPVGSNDYASPVLQNTVSNRNGNVTEYSYNQLGNPVRAIQFTRGLHPGEPASYTTLFAYNQDGLMLSRTNAEVDSTQYSYDSGNPDRLQQGNLLQIVQLPGPRGGDQAQVATAMSYETNFNFVATSNDGRTNVMSYTYDAQGNCTNVVHRIPSITEDFEYNVFGQMTAHVLPDNGSAYRRRDEMNYYIGGPQNGYLQSRVVDAGNLGLTTTYEYDNRGNIVRTIDPRGNDTLYTFNDLNQVVRQLSRELSPTNAVRYQTDTFFDANDKVVRVDRQNRDENGILVIANPVFTATYIYDILGNRIAASEEMDPLTNVVTEYSYDANQNRVLIRYGAATAGSQTNNVVQTLYDERDLAYQETRGPGGADQSTTRQDYDGSGNLIRVSQGLEDVPGVRETIYAYDGYDRRISSTDAMGNVTTCQYDPNGNVVLQRVDGELLDGPSGAGNVRLSEIVYQYDAMDRRILSDRSFFDTQTQVAIGDGFATTLYTYTDASQPATVVDDNGRTNTTVYDTAYRRSGITDAKTNTATYAYDANNNVTNVTEVDKSDLGNPDQIFVTRYEYDHLDRMVRQVDNSNNAVNYAYDSRRNRVLVTDTRGDTTRYSYDGLNRLVQTARDMDTNAVFTDPQDIVISQAWDDSSRLTSQTDDNGNTTQYTYDALNRVVVTLMADGTSRTNVYDVHDNLAGATDPNGTSVTSIYDLLNRVATNSINRAPDVLGATLETYQYDGLSRVTRASNSFSVVTRRFDGLGSLIRDALQLIPLPPRTTVAQYDGERNLTNLIYANGRVVARTYGALNLPAFIGDNPLVPGSFQASYSYVGHRTERRDTSNGLRLEFLYDGMRRVMDARHSQILGGLTVAQRTYAWDPMHNKIAATDPQQLPLQPKAYQYDAAERLVQSQIGGPVPPPPTVYTLDGAGNRVNVSGAVDPGPYTMNPTTPEPADQQVNQYTTTSFDSRTYDRNGNLTNALAGLQQYAYDYRDRLVQFTDLNTGQTTTNKFDALGRRIEKQTTGGQPTRYYYLGSMEVEERLGLVTVATYVYGAGTHLASMARSGTNYYYLSDDLGSPLKLTDSAGVVVEQYDYTDYGRPSFFDGVGAPLTNSAAGNPWMFRGERYDAETGFGFLGSVNQDHRAGRLIQRSGGGMGNAYCDAPLNDGVPTPTRLPFRTGIPWIDDPEGTIKIVLEEARKQAARDKASGAGAPASGAQSPGQAAKADPAGAGGVGQAAKPSGLSGGAAARGTASEGVGRAAGSPANSPLGGAVARRTSAGGAVGGAAGTPVPSLHGPRMSGETDRSGKTAGGVAQPVVPWPHNKHLGPEGTANPGVGLGRNIGLGGTFSVETTKADISADDDGFESFDPPKKMYVGVSSDNPDAVAFSTADNILGEAVEFLRLNQEVEVLATNKFFYKIRIGNVICYITSNILTSKKVNDIDAKLSAGTGASGAQTAAKG